MTATPISSPQPASTFAEMREVMDHFLGPDLEQGTDVIKAYAVLKKNGVRNSKMEELAYHIACWNAPNHLTLRHPRVAVYAANYESYPNDAQFDAQLAALTAETHPLNSVCQAVDGDLRAYEVAPENAAELPVDEVTLCQTMAYGMMAVENGVDLLVVDSLTTGAAAVGTALINDMLEHTTKLGFESLKDHGGLDIAALVGAIIAARLARVTVILNGTAALAAACIVAKQSPNGADHCVIASCPTATIERDLTEILGLKTILSADFEMDYALAGTMAIDMLRHSRRLIVNVV